MQQSLQQPSSQDSSLDSSQQKSNNDNDNENDENETTEIELLNQGAFGCVYRPNIECDGSIGDKRYVTKVQIQGEELKNELYIGSIVKTIHNYEYYYAPLLSSCEVSISTIGEQEREKCKIISGPMETPLENFTSTKIRYVGNKNILEYFSSLVKKYPHNNQPKELQDGKPYYNIQDIFIKKMYKNFYHGIKGIQKLQEKNIVHYDVKEKNIMYDELNQSQIFIDFGLSLDFNKTYKKEDYQNLFYSESYYPYWCIDIYIISFIVQNFYYVEKKTQNMDISQQGTSTIKGGETTIDSVQSQTPQTQELTEIINEEILQIIITEYINKKINLIKNLKLDITKDEIEIFRKKITDFTNPYIGKSWDELFNFLVKKEIYNTWDVFSLALTYMIISKELNFNLYRNDLSEKCFQMWKSIVLASPPERKNVEQTIVEMQNMFSGNIQPIQPTDNKLGFFGL